MYETGHDFIYARQWTAECTAMIFTKLSKDQQKCVKIYKPNSTQIAQET
jgi:hypothetical protein